MPTHPVINRRGAGLEKQNVSMSPASFAALKKTAALMHVSAGSLADAAVQRLTGLPPEQIAQILKDLGWLTEAEHAKVLEVLSNKPADDGGPHSEKAK